MIPSTAHQAPSTKHQAPSTPIYDDLSQNTGGPMRPLPGALVTLFGLLTLGYTSDVAAQTAARGPQPTPPCGPNLTIKNVDKQSRCFELRTYTVREGSSIDLLHSRFRDHTTALFKKHGMTIIGYW